MIRTNELMTGDWVYMEANRGYEAQYIQVETIPDASSKDHYGHIGAFPVGGDNDFRDIEDRHLFPIPLTPEILEKNGFRYNDMPFVQGWEQFGLTLYYGDNEYLINCGQNVAMKINAVHQLQHALQLCGIKKEIRL